MDITILSGPTSNPTPCYGVTGSLMIPRSGLWTCDMLIDDTNPPPPVGTQVSLTTYDSTRIGTVTDSGDEYLQGRVRIVGGNGRFNQQLSPRDYLGQTGSAIAADCLTDAGETVGDLNAFSAQLTTWSRSQTTLAVCLRRLCSKYPDTRIYASNDGAINAVPWLPVEVTDTSITWLDMEISPMDHDAIIGPDGVQLYPMQIITVFNRAIVIERIQYLFEPDSLRAQLWWSEPET